MSTPQKNIMALQNHFSTPFICNQLKWKKLFFHILAQFAVFSQFICKTDKDG